MQARVSLAQEATVDSVDAGVEVEGTGETGEGIGDSG
jgi:hypothetical protein